MGENLIFKAGGQGSQNLFSHGDLKNSNSATIILDTFETKQHLQIFAFVIFEGEYQATIFWESKKGFINELKPLLGPLIFQ